ARGSVAPPFTVAVYVVPLASAPEGTSVAVLVALLYVTTAATRELAGLRSSNVFVPIVVASIPSLKVAVTLAVALTPVAPFSGETAVMVGGVESVTSGWKTTSTQ